MQSVFRDKQWSQGKTVSLFFFMCLVAIIFAGILYQEILTSFAVGLVVSYLLLPAVEWFCEKYPVPRRLVVVGAITSFILFIAVLILAFAPQVYREITNLIDLAPSAYRQFFYTWLPDIKAFLLKYQIMTHEQLETIDDTLGNGENIVAAIRRTATALLQTAPKVFNTVVGMLLAPLVSYLILQHIGLVKSFFFNLVPRKSLGDVRQIMKSLNGTLRAVVMGQVYVATTLGLMYAIGFSVVGLQTGAAIGVVCGIARFVPYLDIVVAIFLSFVVIVSSFSGWPVVIGVAGVILIVQLIDGTIVTPRIIGGKLGINPILIICSIVAFSGLFGFIGVLIAIPALAVLKEGLRIVLSYYQKSQYYQGK